MILKKVTKGYVIQIYDTDEKKFTSQCFVPEGVSEWIDTSGHKLLHTVENAKLISGEGSERKEPQLSFDMMQPFWPPQSYN